MGCRHQSESPAGINRYRWPVSSEYAHVVYFHRASRLAFVGDVLFRGSIGRSDFPRGDYDALVRSIRTKLFPLGDDVRFVPGHGPMSTFGAERGSNPFVGDAAVGMHGGHAG